MGNFKVGDVVVCVDVRPFDEHPLCVAACKRLSRQAPYRVLGVGVFEDGTAALNVGVRNDDIYPRWNNLWGSYRFRHLPKADEQFTAKIRALKPACESQPA
jgi:hypothetical protein